MALRCEDPKLIIRVINVELVQPIRPRYINVTDGRTDGQTTYDFYRALHYVHRAVKINGLLSYAFSSESRRRTHAVLDINDELPIFRRLTDMDGMRLHVAFGEKRSEPVHVHRHWR